MSPEFEGAVDAALRVFLDSHQGAAECLVCKFVQANKDVPLDDIEIVQKTEGAEMSLSVRRKPK